jgi:hypothetical protein
MLKMLGLIFYNIISYNFVLYFMYITTHLHVIKDFWNFKILRNILKFYKIQIL